jgi:hypothetical protein
MAKKISGVKTSKAGSARCADRTSPRDVPIKLKPSDTRFVYCGGDGERLAKNPAWK